MFHNKTTWLENQVSTSKVLFNFTCNLDENTLLLFWLIVNARHVKLKTNYNNVINSQLSTTLSGKIDR